MADKILTSTSIAETILIWLFVGGSSSIVLLGLFAVLHALCLKVCCTTNTPRSADIELGNAPAALRPSPVLAPQPPAYKANPGYQANIALPSYESSNAAANALPRYEANNANAAAVVTAAAPATPQATPEGTIDMADVDTASGSSETVLAMTPVYRW